MAIEFVGRTTTEASGALSLTALSGGIGSAPIENDLVIVAVFGANSSDQDIAISGYTEVADIFANGTNDTNLGVFIKKMGSTPDTSVTVPSLTNVIAVVYVLRGVDAATPQDATATTATKTNSGIPDPPSITTATNGAMIVILSATRGSAGSFSPPSGYTNSVVKSNGSQSVMAASKTLATAGSDNPGIWTGILFDQTSYTCASVTMALRPGAGGGNVKIWNGSAWVAKPVKVWNGSTWVTKPLKRWNGAAWVTTPY